VIAETSAASVWILPIQGGRIQALSATSSQMKRLRVSTTPRLATDRRSRLNSITNSSVISPRLSAPVH
jgi:hypothetical protein